MSSEPAGGLVSLEQHECWELLRANAVARLAVLTDGRPDIFPINYVVDHGTIVFRTAEGTKLSGALEGEAVAVEADGYDDVRGLAWSVVIRGRAGEINTLHDLLDIDALPLAPWHDAPKNRFVRVVPDSVSGRRFPIVDPSRWTSQLAGAPRAAME